MKGARYAVQRWREWRGGEGEGGGEGRLCKLVVDVPISALSVRAPLVVGVGVGSAASLMSAMNVLTNLYGPGTPGLAPAAPGHARWARTPPAFSLVSFFFFFYSPPLGRSHRAPSFHPLIPFFPFAPAACKPRMLSHMPGASCSSLQTTTTQPSRR